MDLAREKRRVKRSQGYTAKDFSPVDTLSLGFNQLDSIRKPAQNNKDYSFNSNDSYSSSITVPQSRNTKNLQLEKAYSSRRNQPDSYKNDTHSNIFGNSTVTRSYRVAPRGSRSHGIIDGKVIKSSGYSFDRENKDAAESLVEVTLANQRHLERKPARTFRSPPPPISTTAQLQNPHPPLLTPTGMGGYSRRRASQVMLSPSVHLSASIGSSKKTSPTTYRVRHSPTTTSQHLPATSNTVESIQRQLSVTSLGDTKSPTENKSPKTPTSARRASRGKEIHQEIIQLINIKLSHPPGYLLERPETGGRRNKSTFANLGNTVCSSLLINSVL
jgi:hypothetical protein